MSVNDRLNGGILFVGLTKFRTGTFQLKFHGRNEFRVFRVGIEIAHLMWVLLQVVKLPANRGAIFSVWSAAVEENQFVAFATNTKVGRYGKAVARCIQ